MKELELIKNVLKKHKVNVNNLSADTMISELNIDSLDLMMIILEIEKNQGLHFDDQELLNIKKIQNVIDLLKKN